MLPEMGALVTRALRPIRSFNIENRAHRVISKEKPTPAPMYPKNVEDLKRITEEKPELDDLLNKKDPGLDQRLRDVYVTATGTPEDDITRQKQMQNTNRPLPENRKQVEEFEFGFKEPERIPYGRTSLRYAINFITAHQCNPKEITASKIAEEYKLKVEHVEDILKYFKTFEVYVPESKSSPALFAGPSQLRKQLEQTDKLQQKQKEQLQQGQRSIEKIKLMAQLQTVEELEAKNEEIQRNKQMLKESSDAKMQNKKKEIEIKTK